VKQPCRARRSYRGPHAGAGHLGQQLGVAHPSDERVEHLARGLPQRVGHPGVELDAGVLEQLLDPLSLCRAALGELLAITGEVAQAGDNRGRDEAPAHQAALESCASHAASDASVLRPGTFLT
jgi:hypothetical protein